MSLSEFADLQRRFGIQVVERGGGYWRQVRPFFFRPVLPVEPLLQPLPVAAPGAWPSSYQYLVGDSHAANSTMNFIMLDGLGEYSLSLLGHKRRNLIGSAARRFQVRPIEDGAELKQHGHPLYLSFFERTGYRYKSDRRDKPAFDDWVDLLFEKRRAVVLGGYDSTGLVGVSVSYWVNTTLVYASLFCDTAAMKKNLGELMFHELRLLAARQAGMAQIYVRNYQGGNSLDQYYLLRGCKLVRMPAFLVMPGPVKALIRWTMPGKFAALRGDD